MRVKQGAWVYRDGYLRSILQARQFVFLSKVCIWKLCWLAVALSGLMLDLEVGSVMNEQQTGFVEDKTNKKS